MTYTRRQFLESNSALGAASLLGLSPPAAAEPPPEIGRIRIAKIPAICLAPEYLAEEMLKLEGFTQVEFPELDNLDGHSILLEFGADISVGTPPDLLPLWDTGKGMGIVALAPIHGGCFELFARDPVNSVRDLKGRRVAVESASYVTPAYSYVASIAAYIGLDPRKDIKWVEGKTFTGAMQLFLDGNADAFLAFPPQPQQLREKKVGRVILNTGVDRPWDQYNCCYISMRREFVAKYPVATKRAVRAILKAADVCAREPERAARYIVAKGYESRYEVALEVVKSLSYSRWRTHNPDDSFRFHGLRLHDVGLIKTPPNKLIAQGTDWRFLNELKKELKA
ncbi:MAG: ABC transporter substrate-binding protein [Burkholderiales bacterium]